MVPLSGARSFVFWTACSSLCTVSLSLLTAALAEAMFASRVAGLTLELDEDEPEPVSPVPCVVVVPLPGDAVLFVVVVVVRLGEVLAGVRGEVLAGVRGEVLVGAPLLGVVLAGVLGEVLVGAAGCPAEGAVAAEAAVRRT